MANKRKYDNKVYPDKVGNERVKQILDMADEKNLYLPKGVSIDDITLAVLNELKSGSLSIVSKQTKNIIPVYLFGLEKWSQFEKTWEITDEDQNVSFPIAVLVQNDTVFGSRYGENRHVLSYKKTYTYLEVPTEDEIGRLGYDIYKIPLETPVDITYDIAYITYYSKERNNIEQEFIRKFSDFQHYIVVNGHYMRISLEDSSNENEVDIDVNNVYIKKFNIKIKGFTLDENEFEKYRSIEKVIKITEINDTEISRESISIKDYYKRS